MQAGALTNEAGSYGDALYRPAIAVHDIRMGHRHSMSDHAGRCMVSPRGVGRFVGLSYTPDGTMVTEVIWDPAGTHMGAVTKPEPNKS